MTTTNESGSRSKTAEKRTYNNRNIFEDVKAAASGRIQDLASRVLGKTVLKGDNLFALNPTRADRHIGSFCINVRSGLWADFATGDTGGDIISFYAYIEGTRQIEAAKELAYILGVEND
jgi:hypothetical protein